MLEIRNIHKTFNAGSSNEVRSLQGVTLSLDEGSFVIVLGTNGSTLLVSSGYTVNDGQGGTNYNVVLQNATGTITPWPS
jgi:putative ABC transport system ATP-binding protein